MLKRAPEMVRTAIATMYLMQQQFRAAAGTTFEQLHFTPDGKLVGDIGELLACLTFDLKLLQTNTKDHDLVTPSGQHVQVKSCAKRRGCDSVSFGARHVDYEMLIVIEFDKSGMYEILYNGPGKYVVSGRKQPAFTRNQLRALRGGVPEHERIPFKMYDDDEETT